MKIDTLDTLLLEEVKDIYDFEKRLTRAIPKMAKGATSKELSSALMEHLEVTKGQVQRLEEVFGLLGTAPKAKPCAGMKGIIEEGDETLAQDGEETLLDLAIIGGARRVEHYEMAAYSTAMTLAEQGGKQEVADLLRETLEEEREADEALSTLASQLLANMPEEGGSEVEETGSSPVKPAKKQTGRAIPARS